MVERGELNTNVMFPNLLSCHTWLKKSRVRVRGQGRASSKVGLKFCQIIGVVLIGHFILLANYKIITIKIRT